jgi:hypothetical protein
MAELESSFQPWQDMKKSVSSPNPSGGPTSQLPDEGGRFTLSEKLADADRLCSSPLLRVVITETRYTNTALDPAGIRFPLMTKSGELKPRERKKWERGMNIPLPSPLHTHTHTQRNLPDPTFTSIFSTLPIPTSSSYDQQTNPTNEAGQTQTRTKTSGFRIT